MKQENLRDIQSINNYERYRLLVEQVKDYAIFMLDETGHVISWNEGAKRIKGYTAQEIIGKHFSIFYPQEDKDNGKPEMELRVIGEVGKYEDEGWRVRKDGSRFWANVVITAIYNDQQQLIGYSKVTRDLTEKKQAEQALAESEERYRLLAAQLNKTVQELAAANEELEQFNSIVSHDLQEPLRTTYSYLVLIQQQMQGANTVTPDTLHYIERAIHSSLRMRELIVSLLNYAILAMEKQTFSLVSTKEIINETFLNLKQSIEETGANIKVTLDVPFVKGNKLRLVQVLQNLVGNALKFRGEKQPEVTIRCQDDAGCYKFAIRDNGIGISAEHIPKVFEVFKRLHTGNKYPGTGIGLSVSKKIVENHGGKIWVESSPGKGSVFYFTIDKNLPVK
ncbi:PAS domain-containing sensor histidine kinase [uncultured Chitinophaga sp.]|jgi:PAS domain S-box|uniref:sensor histidine kinase n=1 Tax=uncultured Chitinophaga sp. TaxID=339340 RepID=UPI0026162D39|nr:PAS domain-containing sensor histidine kinase [uncultured Chitinophaga sp.]